MTTAKIKPGHVLDFIGHVSNEFCFVSKIYLELKKNVLLWAED